MLTDEVRLARNKKIKQAMFETRKRRKHQTACVFQLKIDLSRLNRKQSEALNVIFKEAKWLRNHIVSLDDVRSYAPRDAVNVKLPTGEFEERKFRFLSAQMRQSVLAQVKDDIKGLAEKKKRGHKVGRLKFVKEVTSIDLKQLGHTYDIFPESSKARIQKIPGRVKVHGVEQLEGYELANAKLVSKPSGYYLHVTCFKDNADIVDDFLTNALLGIDFGVSTHLTLSNGDTFHTYLKETERLKRLQRKLSRQKKGSNSYVKTRRKIAREYEKLDNKKNDIANKVVAHITSRAEFIFIQDEMLAQWKRMFGKSIHHSILGRVKAKLVAHRRVFVLKRNVATTQTCVCGRKQKMPLRVRVYQCEECGYTCPRDEHSSKQMVRMGISIFNTCGTQGFKASGDAKRLQQFLEEYELDSYILGNGGSASVKLETATSLAPR